MTSRPGRAVVVEANHNTLVVAPRITSHRVVEEGEGEGKKEKDTREEYNRQGYTGKQGTRKDKKMNTKREGESG